MPLESQLLNCQGTGKQQIDIAEWCSLSPYQQKQNRGNPLGNSHVKKPILMNRFELLLVIDEISNNYN